MTKLHVTSFGLAAGILWGAGMFLLGISAMTVNLGQSFITLFQSVYIGFNASLTGSVIGAVYGFVDGFIGGALLAWLYNTFASEE